MTAEQEAKKRKMKHDPEQERFRNREENNLHQIGNMIPDQKMFFFYETLCLEEDFSFLVFLYWVWEEFFFWPFPPEDEFFLLDSASTIRTVHCRESKEDMWQSDMDGPLKAISSAPETRW